VVVNLSGDELRGDGQSARVLRSTFLDRQNELCSEEVRLRDHEGLILMVNS
jgi:hypothetical protein